MEVQDLLVSTVFSTTRTQKSSLKKTKRSCSFIVHSDSAQWNNLEKMLQNQVCKWIQGEKWYMKKGSLEHEQRNMLLLGHPDHLNCQREKGAGVRKDYIICDINTPQAFFLQSPLQAKLNPDLVKIQLYRKKTIHGQPGRVHKVQ